MSGLPSIQDIAATFTAATQAPETAEVPTAEPAVDAPAEAASGEPAVEAPAAPKEEPKKDVTASRFAALTRKEREVRQRQEEAERRAKAAEEREKQAEERARVLAEREAKLEMVRKNPYKILKEQGLTLQDVINDSLNQYEAPKEDPVEELKKAVEELKSAPNSKVEALEKQVSDLIAEIQNRDYNSAITEVTDNLTAVVTKDPDKYELMTSYGNEGIDLAKDVIREYFQQHQKLLSYEEACDIVEKHYEDEHLERIMKTKKAKARLGSTSSEAAPKESPKQSAPKKEVPKPNTLTNKVATASSEAKVDIDKLSREDAIAFLAKQFTKRN